MKKIIALITLMSFQAYALTGLVRNTANGSEMSATVYNSGLQAYSVVQGGNLVAFPFASPCTSSSSNARIVTSSGSSVLFKTALNDLAFPNNVSITALKIRVCYSTNGTTNNTLKIIPQYKNLAIGTKYENATPVVTVASGTYFGTVTSSAVQTWTLGTPISSSNWANIEIGFRIDTGLFVPGNAAVIGVHGFQVEAEFTATTPVGVAPTASISYNNSNPTWVNRVVTATQPINPPSGGESIVQAFRCGDNLYYEYPSFIVWGTPATGGNVVRAFPISLLNSFSICGAHPLSIGQTTQVRSQAVVNGVKVGAFAYSNSVTLN